MCSFSVAEDFLGMRKIHFRVEWEKINGFAEKNGVWDGKYKKRLTKNEVKNVEVGKEEHLTSVLKPFF